MRPLPSPLLVVTDRHQACRPLADVAAAAAAAGARWFWLRDRDLPAPERRQLAGRIAAIIHGAGGVLSVGDDIALAEEIGSLAVHMRDVAGAARARRQLGPSALIGLSAHRAAELREAGDAGADYATLSPIYATVSKPGYGPALGIETLRQAVADSPLPVVALGGLTPGTVPLAKAAGSAAVAVMGAIMRAPDPAEAIRKFLAVLGEDHLISDAAHRGGHPA